MISVYQLKPRFISLLRPCATWLAQRGHTANQVTFTASLLSVIYGALLLAWPCKTLWAGLPLFLFIRMALNAIDGILAREFNQKSRLGALLNEMGDVVADAALFVPLAILYGVNAWLVGAFIWFALLTEYAGVLAQMIQVDRRYDGPMGKSDRALIIGTLGLFIGLGGLTLGQTAACIINTVLVLAVLLMVWTTWNRLSRALKLSNDHSTPAHQENKS